MKISILNIYVTKTTWTEMKKNKGKLKKKNSSKRFKFFLAMESISFWRSFNYLKLTDLIWLTIIYVK